VWLQQDLTDANIAEQLIEHGILRERIVLGFQPPYKRGMHGFANGEIQDHAA
jgi:XisI protein